MYNKLSKLVLGPRQSDSQLLALGARPVVGVKGIQQLPCRDCHSTGLQV